MSFFLTFIILFSFWILLSGHFDLVHLSLGVACTLFVTHVSHHLLVGQIDLWPCLKTAGRFIAYLPWLFYQILLANLDVAFRTLHPRLLLDPDLIRFKTDLTTDFGRVTLANSITLTPGTVTVHVQGGEYIVHALAKELAEGLRQGQLQSRVKYVEGGGKDV